MPKRGQVTVFIIIALIILLFFTVFYFSDRDTQRIDQEKYSAPVDIHYEASRINQLVTRCLDQTLEEAVTQVGRGGGFLYPPNKVDKFKVTEGAIFTYMYYRETEVGEPITDVLPTLDQIKKDLEDYMDALRAHKIRECFDDFVDFKEEGISVVQGKPHTEITFAETGVVGVLSYPLKVSIGDKVLEFGEFRAEVPMKFKKLHQAAQETIEKVEECERAMRDEIIRSVLSCDPAPQMAAIEKECAIDVAPPLQMATYNYNQTTQTLDVTACHDFGFPIGRKCKHQTTTQIAPLITTWGIIDQTQAYPFLFATRINVDVTIPGEVDC